MATSAVAGTPNPASMNNETQVTPEISDVEILRRIYAKSLTPNPTDKWNLRMLEGALRTSGGGYVPRKYWRYFVREGIRFFAFGCHVRLEVHLNQDFSESTVPIGRLHIIVEGDGHTWRIDHRYEVTPNQWEAPTLEEFVAHYWWDFAERSVRPTPCGLPWEILMISDQGTMIEAARAFYEESAL